MLRTSGEVECLAQCLSEAHPARTDLDRERLGFERQRYERDRMERERDLAERKEEQEAAPILEL